MNQGQEEIPALVFGSMLLRLYVPILFSPPSSLVLFTARHGVGCSKHLAGSNTEADFPYAGHSFVFVFADNKSP